MTTSSLRTRSTLVSEAFHANRMFHKHGPAPVSEKCGNESRWAEEMQALYTLTHLHHTHHNRNKLQGSPLRSGLRLRSTGGGWHSVMCIALRGGVLGLERKPMWAGGGTCFPREENSTVPGVMGT